jgi:ubiquinone/menaquinone biosynthesis C-methylase UbiE
MPVPDHFTLIAPFYEHFIRLRAPDTLISLLDLPVGGRLLDAGGGTGRVAQALRGLVDQVVVADLSLGMLSQAQKKEGLQSVNSHTERLPFPDKSFSRVLMVDALHHVCDHRDTALELFRVLEPGGLLVIEEPDVRKFSVKLVALAEKLALMRSHFLSPPRIAALFPKANQPIRIHKEGFSAYVIINKGEA